MTQTPKTQFPILRLQYTIPKFSSHVPHDNFSPVPLNNHHDARRELACPPGHSTQNSTQLRSTPIVEPRERPQNPTDRSGTPAQFAQATRETTDIRDDAINQTANYRTMETNRTSGTAEPNQTRRSNCGRGGQRRQGRQRRDRAKAL
jgi:hypothetical protein